MNMGAYVFRHSDAETPLAEALNAGMVANLCALCKDPPFAGNTAGYDQAMNPQWSRVLKRFTDSLAGRGKSPLTIRKYERQVYRFSKWLDGRKVLDATRVDVDDFAGHLMRQGLKGSTRAGYLASLSTFYEWAIFAGLTDSNPVSELTDRPRAEDPKARPIPDSALERALAAAVDDTTMRLWLLLGAHAGLRCMEIAGLGRSDLVEDHTGFTAIRVTGKGRHHRAVPIAGRLPRELAAADAADELPLRGPVFVDRRGEPFSAERVSRRINRFLHGTVGLDSEWTAHTLRHYYGSKLYEKCKDLYQVQKALGHSALQTSAIYAKFNNQSLADTVGDTFG